MILVDANLLLRAILGDDSKQAQAAADYFDWAKQRGKPMQVHELALAETAWVLIGKGWSRAKVADALLELCADARFSIQERETVESALQMYASHPVSFVDAFQAAYVIHHRLEGMASFDRDFEKLAVHRIEPKLEHKATK